MARLDKQIVKGEHVLNQAVLSQLEVFRRCCDLKLLIVHLHAEAVQGHLEQLLALWRAKIAP